MSGLAQSLHCLPFSILVSSVRTQIPHMLHMVYPIRLCHFDHFGILILLFLRLNSCSY